MYRYRLSEVRSGHSLDECINELDTLSKGERVKYWVDFHNNVCIVFNTSKTTDEPFGFICCIVPYAGADARFRVRGGR